jgi:hypothetical protein
MCHLHHGTKMKLNNLKNIRYGANASRAKPEHGVLLSSMFVQYAYVLELLQSPTSPNYEDSKESFKGTKRSYNERILLDMSAEPLGTRRIDPKVPQEIRKEFCRVKGKQFPGRGKL